MAATRVLLVDPDEAAGHGLARALRGVGYEVTRVARGAEAIEVLEGARVDAVVFDLMLPDMSGFELADRVRSMESGIHLVATTGVFDTRHGKALAVERHGLADVLARPVAPGDLVSVLGNLPERDSPPVTEEPTRPDVFIPPEKPPKPPVDVRALTPLAPLSALQRQVRAERGGATAQGRDPLERTQTRFLDEGFTSPVAAELPRRLQRGDFDETPFPALLHKIYTKRVTGALYLRQDRKKKVVYLLDGLPRQVKSNLLQECLGRILLKEGLITREELDRSIEVMHSRGMLQGQVLQDMGSLTEHSLRLGLVLQLKRKLLEVFGWERGMFRLSMGARLPDVEVQASLSIPELIREGMIRMYPAHKVAEEVERISSRRVTWASDPRLRDQPMGLTGEEEVLFASLDGKRTVAQIVSESALGRDRASRILLALIYAQKATFT